MKSKTKKSQIRESISQLKQMDYSSDPKVFVDSIEHQILNFKIKFPLLEFFAEEIIASIPSRDHLRFVDIIVAKNYIGSYVIAGKVLQLRLSKDMKSTFEKAIQYFTQGDEWYCCDIISERVFGEALLLDFDRALSLLKQLTKHPNPWVRRGIGVAIHYATKRKVGRVKAQLLLDLTLTQVQEKHIEIKKGFGWGLKTLSKFHPDIVKECRAQIEAHGVSKYYKTKMEMGFRMAESMNKGSG
ncbi:MAG: DNA alkylation repair protein [Bacteroidota bacterium]